MATIYKRGSQWWGRVQREGHNLRQPLRTTSKSVARRRLKDWLGELDRVAWGEKPRHTFDDLALQFIDHHLPRLKPRSAQRYVTSLKALSNLFEGLYLDQITSERLSAFETERRRLGSRIPENMQGKKTPRPIRSATIRRDLACLSSMFGYAIELEWVDANPKRGKRRGLRESPPRRRYLPIHEEELLAAARDKFGSRDLHDAIVLAIDTGMRHGELFSLERARVRLERNEVVLVDGTKNAKPRNVPLLPRARDLLAQKPAHLRAPFLLVNPETGTRYQHMNRGLAGAARRAGIEPLVLVWHDLRRTCGCRLLQEHGLSMEQVSRWLGHSSVTTTERIYAFLEDEHLQRAIGVGTKPGTAAANLSGDLYKSGGFRSRGR